VGIYGPHNKNSGLKGGGEFYDFISDGGQDNGELLHEIIHYVLLHKPAVHFVEVN
jgi:hypothetical protein